MPFTPEIDEVAKLIPAYKFHSALSPSEQKAAFHVTDHHDRHLCLKLIAPDFELARLEREILALQQVKHPNVVSFYEYVHRIDKTTSLHYIVEDFVPGEDLQDLFDREAPLDLETAIKLFTGLFSGLAALGDLGLVHRDLKPRNIRVHENGNPVVIDLGLVRHLGLPAVTKTVDGARIGTPLYFSPEQFRGNWHNIDHRTDLFAAGVLFFEAITGQHPFAEDGMTMDDLEVAICENDEYKANVKFAGIPNNLKLLIDKLLKKKKEMRPLNAAQVSKILVGIGAE